MAESESECEECICPEGLPAWLATFGDLMSLLLCFFVLLLSMATFDTQKVDLAIASLKGSLSVLHKSKVTEIHPRKKIIVTPIDTKVEETPDMENLFASLMVDVSQISKTALGPSADIESAEDGFIINIPSDFLFKEGNATLITNDGAIFIKRLAVSIRNMSGDTKQNMKILVIGHTDSEEIKNSKVYKNAWDLSIARAVSITNMLAHSGINPKLLSSAAKGDSEPIATNATQEGRAKNRRVQLKFFMKKTSNDKYKNEAKTVLEDLSKKVETPKNQIKEANKQAKARKNETPKAQTQKTSS